MIAQSVKRCQTSFQGRYQFALQLCAHKAVETENGLCSVSLPTAHSSQRQASLRKSSLTKETGFDPVSAQISVKLSAADRGKTRKTEAREENAKSTCGLIDWGGGLGGLWTFNILKPPLNCSTNTAVQCFCIVLICQ